MIKIKMSIIEESEVNDDEEYVEEDDEEDIDDDKDLSRAKN